MKKIAFLVCLSLVPAAFGAGEPKISFTKTFHDFGTVTKGDKVSHAFVFRNDGDADLVLEGISTSCGCTTANLEKKTYKPGESGALPVNFYSENFLGLTSKTVDVKTNDPNNRRVELKIQSDVHDELSFSPAALNFTKIRRSEIQTREFTVNVDVADSFEIVKTTTDLPFLSVKLLESSAKQARYQVAFSGEDLDKNRLTTRGNITLHTKGTKKSEFKINVYVRLVQPVKAKPSVVVFSAGPGMAQEEIVELVDIEPSQFKVLDIISNNEKLVSAEMVPGEKRKLKIRLSEKTEKGTVNARIIIKTDLKDLEEIHIPVRGVIF